VSGRHVVMFSGGVGSWAAAKRVAERHGTDRLTLVFTDTLIEDADLYRFLGEAAADVGGELVMLADGRTPWDVFRQTKFLGNTRVAKCSHLLKQDVANDWLEANCDPASTAVYVGIDWTEEHRFTRIRDLRAAQGWTYEAPLCERPLVVKEQLFDALRDSGIRPPRLYELGFAHNNCGGGCVKAGIGHFAHLYRVLPDVFAEWEANEAALRQQLGNVAILRDRAGGRTRPLPLSELRNRLCAGQPVDLFDIGGCGCFLDDAPLPASPSLPEGGL